MTFTLNPLEQTILVELLEDSLKTLRGEIIRTDSRRYRTRLREREQVLEDVLGRLRRVDAGLPLDSGWRAG